MSADPLPDQQGVQQQTGTTQVSAPAVFTLVSKHIQPEYCTFDVDTIQALAQLANRIRNEIQAASQGSTPLVTFLIRRDSEGIATYRDADFLQSFRQAKKVHRVQINVQDYARDAHQNKLSLRSLDVQLENTIIQGGQANAISVAGESQTWVDGIISALQEIVQPVKNRHIWFYRPTVHGLAQIVAVLTFTVYSVLISQKVAPRVPINNAEVYVFIITLLFFSNVWTYASNMALGFLQKRNPVVELISKRKSRIPALVFWTITGGLVVNALWHLITLILGLGI